MGEELSPVVVILGRPAPILDSFKVGAVIRLLISEDKVLLYQGSVSEVEHILESELPFVESEVGFVIEGDSLTSKEITLSSSTLSLILLYALLVLCEAPILALR